MCARAIGGTFFSGFYQKIRRRDFFKLARVRILKQLFELQNKVKNIAIIRLLFLTSTVVWQTSKLLSLKPDLGHFQSLVRNFSPQTSRFVFIFYVEISTRTTRTSHEIANVMRLGRVAELRKTSNLSRDIMYAQPSP